MAKLRLPEQLKSWKVISALSDKYGFPAYSVARVEFDGTQTNAVMTVVSFSDNDYISDNVDLVTEEASFVKTVSKLRGVSGYIDAVVDNQPAKGKISLYLLSRDLPSLSEEMNGKAFTEKEIVDFGLKMSELLDKLEQNNIFHGSINPDNIFIAEDGRYLLGGFTAFDTDLDNLTYSAPEVYENAQPDYTTDIYSIGLIMYAMSNGGKLPFEDECSRGEAMQKRFSKAPVTAPTNGSEKLKSVIVIACQPDNKNRWKNAGNIKNALASIKAELPVQAEPSKDVIVPESTEFESNVFEEFAFDEVEETPEQNESMAPAAPAAAAMATAATVSAASPIEETPAAPAPEADIPEAAEPEIDNRVFDNYIPETKVFNINDATANGEKDYGDFFDEDYEEPKNSAPINAVPPVAPAPVEEFDGNAFYNPDPDEKEPEQEKTSRKGLIAAIIIIVLLLAALAGYGVFAYQNSWFPFQKSSDSGSDNGTNNSGDPNATVPATTVPATTAPSTQPTTTAEETYPLNIIGYSYDFAEDLLKEQGYKVEIGEYQFSDDFDNYCVISMSADPEKPLPKGSTITVVVSKGSESGGSDNSSDNNRDNSESGNDSERSSGDSENNDSSDGNERQSDDGGDNVVQTAVRSNSTNATATNTAASTSNNSGSTNSSEKKTVYMRVSASGSDNNFSPYKGNTSYLSESEVKSMSREELNLALNEIYARRGRIFTNSTLSSYFNSQSWYKPAYNEDEFVQNVVFNDYESKNVDLIRKVQEEKGYY